jgi:molecular chaperone GrpE
MITKHDSVEDPSPSADLVSSGRTAEGLSSAGAAAAPVAGTADSGGASPGPEPALTLEQIEALQARAAKADEHWDRLLRTRADLDNYKKRAARERQDAVRFANLSLVEKLIPALDSFEMALAAVGSQEGNHLESLKAGIAMVHSQLRTALADAGLQEVDATRQVFDPNVHEAVSHVESSELPEGHVLQQLRKGYKLHERLIRPATVVVAKKPAA